MTMRLDHTRLTGLPLDKVYDEGEQLAKEPTPLHDEVDRRLRVNRLQNCHPMPFLDSRPDALADWGGPVTCLRWLPGDPLPSSRWHYTDADLEDQDTDADTTPTDVVLPSLPRLTREGFAMFARGDEARARNDAEQHRARALVRLRRIIVAALALAVLVITGIAHVLTGTGVM